ncbi:MAG: DUF2142 domain-containing protein [Sphingobium sp.]
MRIRRFTTANGGHTEVLAAPSWDPLEKLLLLAVCLATMFFVCITPPFQAPDENQHYMKALLLSEGRVLTEKRGALIGADLPRAAVELHAVDFPTEPTPAPRRFDTAMLAQSWAADAGRPGTRFAEFPNVASYAPTLYAPGAAGLMIGDALGLPRLGAFYTGRIVNAAFAIGLLLIALRLLPFGRSAMLAVALLPTFAYQNGSLSPDAVINSIGFLGLALALHIGFMPARQRPDVGLLVTAPLLALAKGVYLPLLAAGLRPPSGWGDRRCWLILAAMVIGAAAFCGWTIYSGGSQALYHIMSRKTGESVMTAPLADQLAVILNDPVAFVRILVTSVTERLPVYLLQIVGRFGWNAILLPLAVYPLAAIMLLAGMMSGSGARFPLTQRLWWVAVAIGVALLIEIAMYLTGTPLAADFIQGTQGRYFLPMLPLLLLALSSAQPARGARRVFAGSALLLLGVAAWTVFDSFWVHGFITADGMPPFTDRLRALLLPSPRW